MMKEFITSLINLLLSIAEFLTVFFVRPLWKWFAHFCTNQCELERIVFNNKLSNYDKNELIEYSLKNSRSLDINRLFNTPLDDLTDYVDDVVLVKRIDASKRLKEFKQEFILRLQQIAGYEHLKSEVETERTNFYDSKNDEHERSLLNLWTLLMPDTVLENRISNQWTQIGFQGDDPATDFRGMGLLGLNQLIYFSSTCNKEACSIMTKSNHPTKGYPFAIVGISMTSLLRDLLRGNHLKKQFSLFCSGAPRLKQFHSMYCNIFIMFDRFWYASNPASIMDYVPLRNKFYENLIVEVNRSEDVFDLSTSK